MDAARRWRQDEFLGVGARDAVHLIAIRDAALILAPRGLLSAPEEIRAGDMVVNADLGPMQSAEVFNHVSARAIEAVCLLMVSALNLETLISVIP
jgi:hypothetical protein